MNIQCSFLFVHQSRVTFRITDFLQCVTASGCLWKGLVEVEDIETVQKLLLNTSRGSLFVMSNCELSLFNSHSF